MKSLIEVRQTLEDHLKNETMLRTIAARLILRTGVNLLEPAPYHLTDKAIIKKVCDNLKVMGFDIFDRPPA